MFFVEAVMRRFLKANFKKSIVLSYDRKTASIAGCLPFFLLPRRADLIRVCPTLALYKGGGPVKIYVQNCLQAPAE